MQVTDDMLYTCKNKFKHVEKNPNAAVVNSAFVAKTFTIMVVNDISAAAMDARYAIVPGVFGEDARVTISIQS